MESPVARRPKFLNASPGSGVERNLFGNTVASASAPMRAPFGQPSAPAPVQPAATVIAAPPPAPAVSQAELDGLRKAAVEKLAQGVDMLKLQSDRLADQVRSDAIEIAFLVARRILESELKTNTDALFSLVRAAVKKSGESRQIVIRLCPADVAIVDATRGRTAFAEMTAARVEVLADPNLTAGDCIIDADFGKIDGRLSTRFEELRRAVDNTSGDGR